MACYLLRRSFEPHYLATDLTNLLPEGESLVWTNDRERAWKPRNVLIAYEAKDYLARRHVLVVQVHSANDEG